MAHTTTFQPVLSAGTLTGDAIVNQAGEDLGKVEEFMLDLPNGRIRYVVLSFGGFLGMGNKLFAIPPESFTVDTENHRLILNVSKEQLESAPGFDKDDWPDTSEPEWQLNVYRHYGVNPYWR